MRQLTCAGQQKYRRMIRELPVGGYCDLMCLVLLTGAGSGQGQAGSNVLGRALGCT